VDDALRAAGGLFRNDASAVLPYYALLAATADVARLPLLVGVIVVYLVLSSTGRLEPLVDDLAGVNPELLAPENPSGLPAALTDRLAATLLSPEVVGPLSVAVLVGIVCYVLARGVTRAAALGAVDAALDDRDALAAGVAGTGRWRTFAGLVVVRWGLLVVAGVPLLAAVAGGIGTLGTTPETTAALDQAAAVAVLAAFVGIVVTVVAVLVVLALLAFAGPAAVVDDVGVRGAIRRSAGVPLAHPGGFVFYAVVVVASYVALGVGAIGLGVAGVDRVVALVSTFLLTPLLDGVAVALYAGWVDERNSDGAAGGADDTDGDDRAGETDRRAHNAAADEGGFVFGGVESDTEPSQPTGMGADRPTTDRAGTAETAVETDEEDEGEDAGATRDDPDDGDGSGPESVDGERPTGLRGAVRAGVAELGGFVRHDWGYVVVAAAVLAVGIAAGWGATAGYGVRIGAPDDPGTVFGVFPVGPFVNIAVNNWLVATSAGFSGLFAGLPTVGTLLFNGLLVGAVAGVVDPLVFAALVGPHGVVELPAIAVAGGVGLRLGHVGWGAWRGSRPRAAVVSEIGRTWRIVVGLAVVFVLAGFVETFVTPQVAAVVLG
jgi:uncharacterized membrane protein SpoIIM required for sporulation